MTGKHRPWQNATRMKHAGRLWFSISDAGAYLDESLTHVSHRCRLAQEATWLLKSNDPEGFTIVDVFAW